jgi:hypothetical protein
MGERQPSIRISEEGFQGRCPPCLLGHRRETRKSAKPKRHTSLNHRSSQPAHRARQADQSLPRARRTSAPTNGSWKSFTSGIWPTRLRWTGPGGVSSRTTSRPSPTEPDPSRSSRRPLGRARRLAPHPVSRARRLAPHPVSRARRLPPRPLSRGPPKQLRRRRHRPRLAPRPPRLRERLSRRRLRARPRLRPLPPARAQLRLHPRPRSKTPRSAGCAAPRRARSPT